MSDSQYDFGPYAYGGFEEIESSQHDPKKYRVTMVVIYRNDGGHAQGEEIACIRHDPTDGLDLIGDREQHEVRARVLAAAPTMLKALMTIASCTNEYSTRNIARTAIAEATKPT